MNPFDFTEATWAVDAACRDSDLDLWFPDDTNYRYAAKYAQDICNNECEVRDECLAHILAIEGNVSEQLRHGIWAGLTPGERYRRARQERRARKTRVVKTCAECGAEFTVENAALKYCGDECRSKSRRRQHRETWARRGLAS